jgi:hypothetical protein
MDPIDVAGRAGPLPPRGYALPYYTRLGGDTEYLISNPGAVPVQGSLTIYGPECRAVGEPLRVQLDPTCTVSMRIRAIVPDHAGHAVLDVDGPVVIGIFYLRGSEAVVVGNALAGRDALLGMPVRQAAGSYGFSYRTQPFAPDVLTASVFVSNPNPTSLGGALTVYGERCEVVDRQQIGVRPGCTREYALPAGRYGFGRVRVAAPAVLNLLHFSAAAGGVTAAELLDEPLDVPEPQQGIGILIDDTHGGRAAVSGDLTVWESEMVAAGITVGHLTNAPLTAAALHPYRALAIVIPQAGYTPPEIQAISNFVTAGGGLFVAQDWGIDPNFGVNPWSLPTRTIMGDDSNLALDPVHNEAGDASRIRFDAGRNFGGHAVVSGLSTTSVSATCTFSGASGWDAVVITDSDSTPAMAATVVARDVGAGRMLVLGDSNILADMFIVEHENRMFGLRCAEWVTFQV